MNTQQTAWCPGCGNFPILKTFNEALEEAEINRRNLVLVSGIGQAAKFPHYTDVNYFNGLHGRALPAATGIKMANHRLNVIITSGDGDMYGEGGNHLLHAMRRNIGVKVFVHNNQVYGLTKGQASPTSEWGFSTKLQPDGVINAPFNPLAMAVINDCSLVGRSCAADREHLKKMMIRFLSHEGGFALLDILQPCVSFNKLNTYQWYKKRIKPVAENHDPRDRDSALKLAMKWDDEIPVGIIYQSERAAFEKEQPVLKKSSPLTEEFNR